uniref:Palmitoleoyl-protein carboxylesterase NOTUM n=1 Tax=Sus scrofa TaxID=9823 RepID=A0A480FS19_PIG
MCMRNWATFISCPVSWSRMVGQEGLQWGQGQLSTRWTGQPFRGALLALWLSWRLLSQQCSARGSEVPLTWTSVQWLRMMISWERQAGAKLAGTSLSVFRSSRPRFWMYSHWPSCTGCPVRCTLSTVSWASSNSHCTTNTGPGGTAQLGLASVLRPPPRLSQVRGCRRLYSRLPGPAGCSLRAGGGGHSPQRLAPSPPLPASLILYLDQNV